LVDLRLANGNPFFVGCLPSGDTPDYNIAILDFDVQGFSKPLRILFGDMVADWPMIGLFIFPSSPLILDAPIFRDPLAVVGEDKGIRDEPALFVSHP
jgi:hypothetical protein